MKSLFLIIVIINLTIAIWLYSDCIVNSKNVDYRFTFFVLFLMILNSVLIGFWFEYQWSINSKTFQIGGGLMGALIFIISMLLSIFLAIWKGNINNHKRNRR